MVAVGVKRIDPERDRKRSIAAVDFPEAGGPVRRRFNKPL
jgi:hypothetical protein